MIIIVDDRCVVCGKYVPEGSMVCPECLKKINDKEKDETGSNYKKIAISK